MNEEAIETTLHAYAVCLCSKAETEDFRAYTDALEELTDEEKVEFNERTKVLFP